MLLREDWSSPKSGAGEGPHWARFLVGQHEGLLLDTGPRRTQPDRNVSDGCGDRVDGPCRVCGNLVAAGNRFCPECGTPLSASGQPSARSSADAWRIETAQPEDRRLVSVLVATLPALSELADRLDPEDLRYLQNLFLELFGRAVRSYDATLAKASSSELVAWFGAPLGHEDDPERAVLAGLHLLRDRSLSEEIARRGQARAQPQVGVATGEMVAGLLPDGPPNFTVLGPTVDLARRLAAASGPGEALIAELTHRLVRGSILTETTQSLVTDRGQLVSYRVLGSRSERGRESVAV